MKTSKTVFALLACLLVLGANLHGRPAKSIDRTAEVSEFMVQAIYEFYGVQSSHQNALYVGSEVCLACHSGPNAVNGFNASPWRNTLHAKPFKAVPDNRYTMIPGLGVVADANRNGTDDFVDGLDFNAEGQTTFENYKPFAPILGYSDQTGYTMTIGDVTFRIFIAWGGNAQPAKQRYTVRIPVTDRPTGLSAGTYISPLQFNEATAEWVPYHPEFWWREDGSPIFTPEADSVQAGAEGRSFDRRCSGCHFTGTTIRQDSFGEWVAGAAPSIVYDPDDPTYIDYNNDGIKEMTHIGCESCHGPGSRHVVRHGDRTEIIEPHRDFTALQANEACGACHVRGSSSEGTFGFPWDEANDHRFINGDSLDNYFTPKPGLWPDGKTSRQHHQQFHDLYQSSKPTFRFHQVTCYECHDAHVSTNAMIVDHIDEEVSVDAAAGISPQFDTITLRIPTRSEDNTLCLACHATHGPFSEISVEMVADYEENRDAIAKVVEAHSNHPYAPERRLGLSRCTECHMPKTAKTAINYDIRSHTFEAIPPEKTLMFQPEGGMPNSCSVSCHRNIIDVFPNGFDSNIGSWTEQSDIDLANWLMEYYGPEGKWWKTHSDPGPQGNK